MKNNNLVQKATGILFALTLGISSAAMANHYDQNSNYNQNNQNNADQINNIFGAHINQYPLLPTDNEVRRCWQNTREDFTRRNKSDSGSINTMKQKLTSCWKNYGYFGKQQN